MCNLSCFFLPQWLHQYRICKVLYICYRWIMMCYFLGWLAVTIWHATFYIKFKYLIFLTHWGFIVWNVYLVVSAVTATIALWPASTSTNSRVKPNDFQQDSNCVKSNSRDTCKKVTGSTCLALPWYYKLQWVSFLIGGEYAIAITVLYWSMFYDPNSEHNYYSLDSLNLHLINGIAALIDLWLSGMPVSIYHAIYSISFGFVYILFTAVYYITDGTDPDGNRFIYQVLDYSMHPGAALGLAVLLAVLFIGIIHYFLFIQYVFRYRLTLWSYHAKTYHTSQTIV